MHVCVYVNEQKFKFRTKSVSLLKEIHEESEHGLNYNSILEHVVSCTCVNFTKRYFM